MSTMGINRTQLQCCGWRRACCAAIVIAIAMSCGCEDRYQQGWNDGYESGHSRGYRQGYASGTAALVGDTILPSVGTVIVGSITIVVAASIVTFFWKPVVRGLQRRHEQLEMIRVHELSLAEVARRTMAGKEIDARRLRVVSGNAEAIGRRMTDEEQMFADFRKIIRELGVRVMARSTASRDAKRASAERLLLSVRQSDTLSPAEKLAAMRGMLRRKKPINQTKEPSNE